MPPRERLILFTRYPEPGTTKTRLVPLLGPEGAAALQRRMTAHAMSVARPLIRARGLELEVRYEGGGSRLMREWLGDAAVYRRQGAGNIGRRMARAFRQALDQGCEAVVLVGSDIPGISATLLASAFQRLGDDRVVLGPAADGGYYLIGLTRRGLRRAGGALFDDMAWGTSGVLAESCRRLKGLGLGVEVLEVLADVDRPEDLPVWERHAQR